MAMAIQFPIVSFRRARLNEIPLLEHLLMSQSHWFIHKYLYEKENSLRSHFSLFSFSFSFPLTQSPVGRSRKNRYFLSPHYDDVVDHFRELKIAFQVFQFSSCARKYASHGAEGIVVKAFSHYACKMSRNFPWMQPFAFHNYCPISVAFFYLFDSTIRFRSYFRL